MIPFKNKQLVFFALLLIVSLFQKRVYADKNSYVVYLGSHSHGVEHTPSYLDSVRNSHYQILASVVGSTDSAKDAIFYSYLFHINGFAANMDEEAAEALAKHSNVRSVFPNKKINLHTTHSWSFLGLEDVSGVVPDDSLWKKARYGEDVIIGMLDSGVWPESESLKDEGMGPIPSKWKGICQNITCNRKLIGARYFNLRDGNGPYNSTFDTPRDTVGHGSHTLSTAAGNFVPGANFSGLASGVAKGGSPKSRVAAYKVCWPDDGCHASDIIAGFDAAIADGVDIISMSIGDDNAYKYFNDTIAIGSFHAIKHGILVVCSAGNAGPVDSTVVNVAPWILTVAASTSDREFRSSVQLGNKMQLKGMSLSASAGLEKFYPLISSIDAKISNETEAQLCMPESLDPEKVRDKIVVCLRGGIDKITKGKVAAEAGAVGMILANNEETGKEITADAHVLPTSHITYTDALAVFSYINSTKSPVAYIERARTELGTKPAPVMASFSSKGPNTITPEILKPDITAPGVGVLAAFTQVNESVPFQFLQGTSMACPHIAGIAGLLKTLHPDWTPAAIRSAIMTTATTQDNNNQPILNPSYTTATPFSYGAGHVSPNSAMDPGLVYDLKVKDYFQFLCAVGYNQTEFKTITDETYKCTKVYNTIDLNYPSIAVPNLSGTGTTVVHRRVRNVGSPGTYKVSIEEPSGVSVSVKPNVLIFEKIGKEKRFNVTVTPKDIEVLRDNNYVFGSLTWSDGKHFVRSPIVVGVA